VSCISAKCRACWREIYALDPDVILIDLENPSRDVLEQMFQGHAARSGGPIAMFVDQSDAPRSRPPSTPAFLPISSMAEEGADQAILDLCISRFNAFSKLQTNSIAQIRARGTQGDRPRKES